LRNGVNQGHVDRREAANVAHVDAEIEAVGICRFNEGAQRRGLGINPVKALYWTGRQRIVGPFLLVAILVVASDKKLMQGQPSSGLGWTVVAITTMAMFAAGAAMFVV